MWVIMSSRLFGVRIISKGHYSKGSLFQKLVLLNYELVLLKSDLVLLENELVLLQKKC